MSDVIDLTLDDDLEEAIRLSMSTPSVLENTSEKFLNENSRPLKKRRIELVEESGMSVIVNNVEKDGPCTFNDVVLKNGLKKVFATGVIDINELQLLFELDLELAVVMQGDFGTFQVRNTEWTIISVDNLVHAKLMVLFYDDFVRIVVSSGNLTWIEWKDIRQCVWYQDFFSSGTSKDYQDEGIKTDFREDLFGFMNALGAPQDMLERLAMFDLDKCKIELLCSQPSEDKKYGIHKLKYLLEKYDEHGVKESINEIFFQANTVSVSSPNWYKSFSELICGERDCKLKIIYPTEEYMKRTGILGEIVSLNIGYQTFPHSMFYQSIDISNNPVVLHSKLLYPDNNKWMYFGSHNFTKAAWGTIQYENARNFELGIFIPPTIINQFTIEYPFTFPLTPFTLQDAPGGTVRSN